MSVGRQLKYGNAALWVCAAENMVLWGWVLLSSGQSSIGSNKLMIAMVTDGIDFGQKFFLSVLIGVACTGTLVLSLFGLFRDRSRVLAVLAIVMSLATNWFLLRTLRL